MKNIEKWLDDQGYFYGEMQFIKSDGKKTDGIVVYTDYDGLYPGKKIFADHEKIKKYIKRFYKGLVVESRGFYTGIFIY